MIDRDSLEIRHRQLPDGVFEFQSVVHVGAQVLLTPEMLGNIRKLYRDLNLGPQDENGLRAYIESTVRQDLYQLIVKEMYGEFADECDDIRNKLVSIYNLGGHVDGRRLAVLESDLRDLLTSVARMRVKLSNGVLGDPKVLTES